MKICHSCLRRLTFNQAASLRLFRSTVRRFSETGRSSESASRGAIGAGHEGIPVATSTSTLQPAVSQQKPDELPKSCIPAGTALRGMAFMKNKEPPMAMEDNEYPEWLWGLLKTQKVGQDGATDAEGDIYSKTRKQRRNAAKAARKAALKNPEANIPKIPLEEQTTDLPSGDGTIEGAIQAIEARDELTFAMRKSRKKGIKEANFLKSMR